MIPQSGVIVKSGKKAACIGEKLLLYFNMKKYLQVKNYENLIAYLLRALRQPAH
jgi:hypothetical protein